MKVYVVVEDFDSGPGIASLNICNIFLSEKRANEMKESLNEEFIKVSNENYPIYGPYDRVYYRVEEWEVEE